MADQKPLQLGQNSLKDVCAEQGEPFVPVSPGDNDLVRTLNSPRGPVQLPYRATAMFCGRVRDAVIFGRSYVTHKAGTAVFLGQSPRDYDVQEFANYYVGEIMLDQRPRPQITEECCYLGGLSGEVKFFGHFIHEFLYRLPAFERAGVLHKFPLVVHEEIEDEWLSFIELYGVPRERIIRVPRLPAAHYKSVWVTPCPNVKTKATYALWDEGIHDVRRKLLSQTEGAGADKIFIGRGNAKHRRLVNEGELWNFLKGRGFVSLDFMGMSAKEQIKLVKSAKVIVAVAGSAMVMTHFAPENCAIIELCPAHLLGGLGSLGFAGVIGQSYCRVITEVLGEKAGLLNDMKVDMNVVRATVEDELRRQGI